MPARSTADLTLGNPVMAIGWPDGKPKANACGESKAGCSFETPLPINYSDPNLLGLDPIAPARGSPKIVTWLILPVVICLSQRLSHACLSISNYTVKLRMAH